MQYVTELIDHLENGKQIIWLGVINFNIFCCHIHDGSTLTNPNTHLIAVINSNSCFLEYICQVSYSAVNIKEWNKIIFFRNGERSKRKQLHDLIVVVVWKKYFTNCHIIVFKLSQYSFIRSRPACTFVAKNK